MKKKQQPAPFMELSQQSILQKIEVHIFERASLSSFGMWTFTAKEDLNRRKQVFLHNFRPWPAQKPKIWSILYGKQFISENSVV